MIKLGKVQTLEVSRSVDFGVYLQAPDAKGVEVLLPARYVPEGLSAGSSIDVFVYKDSEDRIVATTEHPYARVGEFAFLEVKEVNDTGAFLDWGLPKDLLVPYGEQKVRMRRGGIYLVYVYVDDSTQRIVASARIERFLGNVMPTYRPGDKVEALVYEHNELGYRVIVDNLHRGMVYANEIYSPIELEESITAYVKRVRDDGKIDLTLRDNCRNRTTSLSDDIMAYLDAPSAGPIGDKMSPERIQLLFSCSKKDFKKAVGHLYRERRIALASDGTILKV